MGRRALLRVKAPLRRAIPVARSGAFRHDTASKLAT